VLNAHVQRVVLTFGRHPRHRGASQRINQLARGVLIGEKEVAVNHGRLQHWNLQAANDDLHLHRDSALGKHVVKHFRQRVYSSPVQLGSAANFFVLAHLTQHVGACRCVSSHPLMRLGCSGMRLQSTQKTHQLGAGSLHHGACSDVALQIAA
jgi:hypothetical protein